MERATKNLGILAACQTLLITNGVVLAALNSLVGFSLANNKSLATLPIATYVIGGALATVPASLLMKQLGRRAGFMIGATLGLIGTLLCTFAVSAANFWLFCIGTVIIGMYNAFGQYYRFAATEAAPDGFQSKAISLVLAGGLVGGVLGPESSKLTKDLLGVPFMGAYASLIVFSLAALALASLIDIPRLPQAERNEHGRPLAEIARQPVFIVAVLAAAVAYGVMNLLMSVTPLAMSQHHHAYNDAAFVIEWHVIAMFAPSFVTPSLAKRFGVLNVMLAGAALMFACISVALSGTAMMNFWVALVLLGVGWNFLYVGGTMLLTQCCTAAERAKTQGVNDFLIFVAMATSSLSSGALVHNAGWEILNYWALPFLALTAAGTLWLASRGTELRRPA
jgi:MFS family permease